MIGHSIPKALIGVAAAFGLLTACGEQRLPEPANAQVPAAPGLSTQAVPNVLIGAIRWDAWKAGTSTTNWGVNPSLLTKYSYRQPFYGWYTIGVSNHQAIIDQEIQYAADNRLDYWAFVWYPDEATGGNMEGLIQGPFNDYMVSSKKSLVKFTVVLQSGWARYNNGFSTYVPRYINYFKDAQYVKLVGNRPLVYLFEAGQTPFSAAELGQITSAATAAGLGAPVYINVDHNTGLGRDGVSSYGSNGANPGGGKHCWQVQANVDTGNLGPYGGQLTVPGLTPMADPRPRGYGFHVDTPTYGQWESHVKAMADWTASHPANTTSPAAMLIYAWNEIDEGGAGIVPTVQHGSSFLEAIKAVKTDVYPSTYTDTLNGDNCSIQYAGGWSNYFPDAGVQGNYGNDEQISTGAGASAELTWAKSTGFEVRGTKGPNRGRMDIYLDGALQGTADTYSATWAQNQTLATISGLSAGNHTLRLVVRADRNPASSDTQIGIDSIRVSVSRNGGGGSNPGNLALGKTYGSSSNWDANQTADKAFDGNANTNWQAASGFVGQTLEVNFGGNTTFNSVTLSEYGDRTQGYRIEYWNGSSWQTAFTGTTIGSSNSTPRTVNFPAVTGSRARIYFTAGSYTPIIYEFEIYNRQGNLASGKTYASSSNWDSNQTADKAFDGNAGSNWQSASGSGFNGQTLEVNFGTNTTFSKVVIAEYGDRTQGYRIEYWNGSSWLTAFTGTTIGSSSATPRTVNFPAVTGSKARIYFTAGSYTPIIYEFELYAQ
jgi:putative Ca2+/H+ antiporter (TMEM165/GDT1 family)